MRIRTQWKNCNIKTKLTLLLVLGGMLPMLLLSFFVYFYSHKIIVDKEYAMAEATLKASSRSLDDMLQKMEYCLQEIMLFPTVISSLQSNAAPPTARWFFETLEVEDILRSVSVGKELPLSITIVGANGNTYTNGELNYYYERFDSELVQMVINLPASGSTLLTSGSDNLGIRQVVMGKSIKRNNRVLGVVLVNLPFSELDELFPELDSQPITILGLNYQNEIFYSKGDQSIPPHEMPWFDASGANGNSSIKLGGTNYMYVLNHSPRQYTLAALIPFSYIYSDSKLYLIYGVLFGLVVIVQMLIYSRTIARSFSRRVQLLSENVADFAQTMQPVSLADASQDEIGQLTNGFTAMSHQIIQLVERVRIDEQKKRALELAALRSQFNPHMLYNTLNTISYLAELQGVDNIQEVSEAFSRLMRTLSRNTNEFVTLSQELDYIRDYMTIKKYNLINELTLNVSMEPELAHQPVIKLLLQPFVENAIVHGFANLTRSARLDIQIFEKAGYINICLSDNGNGISGQRLEQIMSPAEENENHIGVRNTVRRFMLTYHDDCYFNIKSQEGSFTTVELAYPLDWQQEEKRC